jgi:hypothetical protein
MTSGKLSRRSLQHTFRDVLIEAAKHRNDRAYPMTTPAGEMMGWVWYEIEQLLFAVNGFRESRRRKSVSLSEIVDAERQASGHLDYADQLALYCAELALKDWTTSLTH